MNELTFQVEFDWTTCASCGVPFAWSKAAVDGKRQSHETFYCPNGHTLSFPDKSEADRLRDRLREAENKLYEIDAKRIRMAKVRAAAKKRRV